MLLAGYLTSLEQKVQAKAELFSQSGTIDSLTRILRETENDGTKLEAVRVLSAVCYGSAQCCLEVIRRGVPLLLGEELSRRTHGLKLLSEFVVELLRLSRAIMENSKDRTEFAGGPMLKSLATCLSIGKRQTKLEALRCVASLAETDTIRRVLDETDTFTSLTSIMQKAYEDKDEAMAALCIKALASYCAEQKYVILMHKLDTLFPFTASLVGCLASATETEFEPEFWARRCQRAAMSVVRKLAETSLEWQTAVVKEGVFAAVLPCLQSCFVDTKQDAVELITFLIKQGAGKEVPTIIVLLKSLLSLLRDKDETIILRTLECLLEVAKFASLLVTIVKNDTVPTVLALLTISAPPVVLAASRLLIALIQVESGREAFARHSGILLVLSFVVRARVRILLG